MKATTQKIKTSTPAAMGKLARQASNPDHKGQELATDKLILAVQRAMSTENSDSILEAAKYLLDKSNDNDAVAYLFEVARQASERIVVADEAGDLFALELIAVPVDVFTYHDGLSVTAPNPEAYQAVQDTLSKLLNPDQRLTLIPGMLPAFVLANFDWATVHRITTNLSEIASNFSKSTQAVQLDQADTYFLLGTVMTPLDNYVPAFAESTKDESAFDENLTELAHRIAIAFGFDEKLRLLASHPATYYYALTRGMANPGLTRFRLAVAELNDQGIPNEELTLAMASGNVGANVSQYRLTLVSHLDDVVRGTFIFETPNAISLDLTEMADIMSELAEYEFQSVMQVEVPNHDLSEAYCQCEFPLFLKPNGDAFCAECDLPKKLPVPEPIDQAEALV